MTSVQFYFSKTNIPIVPSNWIGNENIHKTHSSWNTHYATNRTRQYK